MMGRQKGILVLFGFFLLSPSGCWMLGFFLLGDPHPITHKKARQDHYGTRADKGGVRFLKLHKHHHHHHHHHHHPPDPPTLNGEKMWDADICSRLFKDCKKSIIVTSNKCLGVRVQIPFSVLDSWTSYHMWIEENMLMSIYTHVCILPIWENDAVCAYLCWEGLRTWEIYNWKGEYRYEICDMWNWQI